MKRGRCKVHSASQFITQGPEHPVVVGKDGTGVPRFSARGGQCLSEGFGAINLLRLACSRLSLAACQRACVSLPVAAVRYNVARDNALSGNEL